jgi:hypothetical protein
VRPIPKEILSSYESELNKRNISSTHYEEHKKWLRYFLDFCEKHPVPTPNSRAEQLSMFIGKLQEKNQTKYQQQRASDAVTIYFDKFINNATSVELTETIQAPILAAKQGSSHYSKAGYEEKSDSSEWDSVLETLAAEIKVRHYSRKTLKTYAQWARKFQRFLKNKPPGDLTTADVKDYLTHLAVNCHVAASTQNQAFNSLLFLFRHALKTDFGTLRDVPRAKKSLYIPAVLSREEIDAILKQLSHPHNLVVNLLFGCGLRLFECLQLRVRDFNFDAGILTVHGKGKKDRTLPLPETILSELKAQTEVVKTLHKKTWQLDMRESSWMMRWRRNIPTQRKN